MNLADSGIDPELLKDFIAETMGEIDSLDEKFIQLEKAPGNTEIIDSIFRPVHSVKGSSAFFNLNNIRVFAHKLENFLDDLRKGKLSVSQEIIDSLLTGIDFLRAMFNRIDPGKLEDKPNQEEEEFLESLNRFAAKKEEEKPKEALDSYFESLKKQKDKYLLKAADNKEILKDTFEIIELLENQLISHNLLQPSEATKQLGEILVEKGKISDADIEEALKKQKKVGTILMEEGKITEDDIKEALTSQEKEKEKTKPAVIEKLSVKKFMRVEEDKVDNFLNYIGELIISSEVYRYLQKRFEVSVTDENELSREFKNANISFMELSNSLQASLMDIRRVSVKSIFQKLPRLVRDLAKNLGKEVDLVLEGEDTSIDKSIIEALENSVIHMVRNSVDHGVELPDEREKKGKSGTGKVEISASADDEYFYLKIKDDGKGLDPEVLKNKAIEKGIATPDKIAVMSKGDILKFIFHAGFSTAKLVTDVSGRGVGMDVVMTEIKRFSGNVDIDSEVDQGSQFTLRFPLAVTLTIIDGLLVSVADEKYVVPLNMIKESVCPKKEQVSKIKHQGEMVNIRDTLYSIIRIHDLFGVEGAVQNPWESVMVVVENDSKHCCLMVDSLLEKQQVVVKDIGKSFKHIETISGGAILGDGKVGLVLDVEGILDKMS